MGDGHSSERIKFSKNMKIVRFSHSDGVVCGLFISNRLTMWDCAFRLGSNRIRIFHDNNTLYSVQVNYGALQEDGVSLKLIDGDPYGECVVTETVVSISDIRRYKLLPPVNPTAIMCVGLNYKRHATECGMAFPEYPVLFWKNPGAACAHGDTVIIPHVAKAEEMDYECELAVVIGKPCKNVSRDEALEYVLGYTCCNDVSAR